MSSRRYNGVMDDNPYLAPSDDGPNTKPRCRRHPLAVAVLAATAIISGFLAAWGGFLLVVISVLPEEGELTSDVRHYIQIVSLLFTAVSLGICSACVAAIRRVGRKAPPDDAP